MRVRLNVRITRKAGKEYPTYYITIPKDVVESLSLSKAKELELEIRKINDRIAIVLYKP